MAKFRRSNRWRFPTISWGGKGRVEQFSSPQPESEELRKLIISLAGWSATRLPRDRARWLELLVDSPFLSGPLGVYADEFAQVGYQLLQPRNKGAIQNSLEVHSLPSGYARSDLVDDLITSGDLVPVPPDFPLNQLLTKNIPRWTGRRLLRMTCLHWAAVGEAFWRLGRPSSIDAPTEALTLTPTEVLEVPILGGEGGRSTGYSLAQTAGVVPASEMFEWSNCDPRSIYKRGRGIVQALGDEVEGAEWMSRLLGTFMKNNNVPPLWILYRGLEKVEEFQRTMDRKHRGLQKFFRMMISRVNDGTVNPIRDSYAVEKMGEPLDPSKADEHSRWAWEFIRQYLRVPPSMLANYDDNSGLGMSGIELERAVFLMSVMTPLVSDFEDTLQDLARREYDDLLVVRHTPFVQTDREFQLRVAEKFEDRFTNDELRRLGGHPRMEDKQSGKSFLVRRGRIPTADLRPGNEALEAAAKSGGGKESSASELPAADVGRNGHGRSLTRGHVDQLKALPGQLSDVERRLAEVDQRLAAQKLVR